MISAQINSARTLSVESVSFRFLPEEISLRRVRRCGLLLRDRRNHRGRDGRFCQRASL